MQFFSGFFIGWDGVPDSGANEKVWGKGMYYKGLEKGAVCRNSNIIEETGQVEFVLSDKTGTLTQNKMQFLKCVIAGESYGQGVTEVQKAQAKLNGEIIAGVLDDDERKQIVADFQHKQDDEFIFYDKKISGEIWKTGKEEVQGVGKYLRALALCNTVQPGVNEKTRRKEYSAESPDGAWSHSCLCIEDGLSLVYVCQMGR